MVAKSPLLIFFGSHDMLSEPQSSMPSHEHTPTAASPPYPLSFVTITWIVLVPKVPALCTFSVFAWKVGWMLLNAARLASFKRSYCYTSLWRYSYSYQHGAFREGCAPMTHRHSYAPTPIYRFQPIHNW